ncbi:acetyl-CoA carboxylase biotin carboxyl carrier protein subunit [Paraburkholderia sp. BL10I2N1]|uniref:acetyl-CoA carboxylase biotin carboxyl carrier protein subunit n=1 Tax=Paraburkholderia sp. BL10I2N1 TaxID=1938796 RepID=UPI00106229E8|nr:acetyl-CoA carboxylase biotin carboxyl carrier protein subunit [Paraburkholderia sp. BL10I2N1]TDN59136.1 biotin-dependent enzyme [Paraburkholderia sp. BL10I2N1]
MTLRTIRSEITGTVWKISAAEGDVLAEDDVIMVLESMKMEIPVAAPDGGKLVRLLINEGDAVREGQDLASFDAD